MRRLGCAFIGASAMIIAIMKFVPVMLAAANSSHQAFSYLGQLALWALLFEAGALLLSTACGIRSTPFKMVASPDRIPANRG
jgi:hypothetical protein